MTKLEEVLANALAKTTNVDIPAIIEAAQACIVGGPSQTVQTTPVAQVDTPAPETEKPKRGRKPAQESVPPPPPAAEPETPPAPPVPPPPVAEPPSAEQIREAMNNSNKGLNITGLFEGSGPGKKVVKAVFLTAVEKATNLAALIAINDICDCGIETGGYSEETSPVLRRRLTRWGMALT